MPRFKPIDTGMKFLPIDLSVQLLPGNFEHALSHLRIPGIGREEAEKPRSNPHKTSESESEFRGTQKSNNQKTEFATALAGASG